MKKIAIIGSGKIGSTEGKLWLRTGHDVMYGSRNPEKLTDKSLGKEAKIGTIDEAISFGQIVLIATPWEAAEELLKDKSRFEGKIIIDASNPYIKKNPSQPQKPENLELKEFPNGSSATEYRTKMLDSVPLVKSYNILTAEFQKEAANRPSDNKVVMPLAGDDATAKNVVAQLIRDSGFEPFDVGSARDGKYMEPPRGESSLYGEEWTIETVKEKLDHIKKLDK